MSRIGFIGVGNMGMPMAKHLIKAGHAVRVFDLSSENMNAMIEAGAVGATSAGEAAAGQDVVITVLPRGEHVRAAYEGDDGVLAHASEGALLIDCSSIGVETARALNKKAEAQGLAMVDAPVSGGVGGAEAATLTFMVGGMREEFERAEPVLSCMGKNIIHTGPSGTGQVAKICNNMALAVQMIGVCEAFVLGEKLGLDAEKLYEIMSTSSAQCWTLTSYSPVPGTVPASPANREYAAGFTVENMIKDLGLSQEAAQSVNAPTTLGNAATALYEAFGESGAAHLDFSGIIKMLQDEAEAPGGAQSAAG